MAKRPGTDSEDQAARYLLNLGYTIVTRRHRTPSGEIDIIALDPTTTPNTLVFVEVKSRTNTALTPEETITPLKARRFHAAVAEYFSQADQPELPARYDLIAITPDRLTHHKEAIP